MHMLACPVREDVDWLSVDSGLGGTTCVSLEFACLESHHRRWKLPWPKTCWHRKHVLSLLSRGQESGARTTLTLGFQLSNVHTQIFTPRDSLEQSAPDLTTADRSPIAEHNRLTLRDVDPVHPTVTWPTLDVSWILTQHSVRGCSRDESTTSAKPRSSNQ